MPNLTAGAGVTGTRRCLVEAVVSGYIKLTVTVAALVSLSGAVPLMAQEATLLDLQRVVEVQSPGGGWSPGRRGFGFATGSALRTGKRSKAEVRLRDGSGLRITQLSRVAFQEGRVVMQAGRLQYTSLQPGRVVAGSAVAEIKGSVGVFTLNDDGSAEFSLYSGAMEVRSAQRAVDLPPGFWVTAFPDGSFSPVRVAPPLSFAFSSHDPELGEAPLDGPFMGSPQQTRVRLAPPRLALDVYHISHEYTWALPWQDHAMMEHEAEGMSPMIRRQAQAGDAAGAHEEEVDRSLGAFSGAHYMAVLLAGESGTGAWGGRVSGLHTRGPWYASLALQPLRLKKFEMGRRVTTDHSAVAQASLTYRVRAGEVQVGRQNFVSGPTAITSFGSLTRSGGRQVMDAVVVRPRVARNYRVEAAYLYDAFVRNLHYVVPGRQQGMWGRAAYHGRDINAGLNVLRYHGLPGPDTLGATLDWAIPLSRNRVEAYGEWGRDPFRRSINTVGIAVPYLLDRYGVDLAIEYARVGDSAGRPRPPAELAVQAYRPIGRHVSVAAGWSRLGGRGSQFRLGLGVGGATYRDRDSY